MRKLTIISLILFLFYAVSGSALAVAPVTDGLVMQLEADAITGLSDGEAITVWPASAGSDAVAAGPTSVIYKTNVINGLPVVRFDGFGGYVNFTPIDDIRTVFWVVKEDADVNNIDQGQWRHLLNRDGAAGFHRGTVAQSTDNYCAIISNEWGGGVGSGEGSDRVRNGVVQINADTVDPLTTSVPRDLSIIFIQTSDVLGANNFSWDDAQGAIRSWDGDLAELLIYNRVLTTAEIRNVGSYLAEKYALDTNYAAYTPATLISPADGAVDVDATASLQWTPVTGTTLQEVYIGTEPNAALTKVGTPANSATSFDPDIDTNSTYYWQIVSYVGPTSDPNNVFMSPVAKFSTVIARPEFDAPYGQQPASYNAALIDDSVTLTAQAGVSPGQDTNITYQWLKNGSPITGETAASLTIAGIVEADGGTYTCQATNSAGTTTSKGSTLKVIKLIGHWPFDGNYNDIVGGNTAAGIGNPAFVDGITGQGVKFNGLGDQAVTVPSAAIAADGNFTLMFWENTDAAAPENAGYICASGTAASGHEQLYMWRWHNPGYNCEYYGNLFLVSNGGLWGPIPELDQYPRGMWHHHAVTYNANTMVSHWYIDGVAKTNTVMNTHDVLAELIYLGNRQSMARPFTGVMDDFRLYNYELPREMIAQIYVDATGNSVCMEALQFDLNGDCAVNLEDFALLADQWMVCNLVPSTACDGGASE
ncbi:MAG: immunoglobulin domain-containing protein [Phycisphaerae bacterium]|nr:immunoglobulin domain-containing protein [Phycisphaerae bacterium]